MANFKMYIPAYLEMDYEAGQAGVLAYDTCFFGHSSMTEEEARAQCMAVPHFKYEVYRGYYVIEAGEPPKYVKYPTEDDNNPP